VLISKDPGIAPERKERRITKLVQIML